MLLVATTAITVPSTGCAVYTENLALFCNVAASHFIFIYSTLGLTSPSSAWLTLCPSVAL